MLSNADLARLVMPLAIGLLIGLERGWRQPRSQPELAPWSDDFASVLPVLRWRSD
ncbi:MgtC/SapB family protein [Sandarakinorhabdus limnophila]|uniref:MgtC/SapB family protein n=1 Tax=Sandarakinorhabdus limnophila TaxID=210512 RepID=UPI0003B388D7|nr:MgtC/SapB family protein [Sandarakinorhabdus limnophila]